MYFQIFNRKIRNIILYTLQYFYFSSFLHSWINQFKIYSLVLSKAGFPTNRMKRPVYGIVIQADWEGQPFRNANCYAAGCMFWDIRVQVSKESIFRRCECSRHPAKYVGSEEGWREAPTMSSSETDLKLFTLRGNWSNFFSHFLSIEDDWRQIFYLNSRPKKLTDWSFVPVRPHTETASRNLLLKMKIPICKARKQNCPLVYTEYVAHCLIIYKAKDTALFSKNATKTCSLNLIMRTHEINQTWE